MPSLNDKRWTEEFFLNLFEPEDERAELKLNERDATRIVDELSKTRILDPAVGSGAFPVGMFQTILQLRSAFEAARGLRIDHHLRCQGLNSPSTVPRLKPFTDA